MHWGWLVCIIKLRYNFLCKLPQSDCNMPPSISIILQHREEVPGWMVSVQMWWSQEPEFKFWQWLSEENPHAAVNPVVISRGSREYWRVAWGYRHHLKSHHLCQQQAGGLPAMPSAQLSPGEMPAIAAPGPEAFRHYRLNTHTKKVNSCWGPQIGILVKPSALGWCFSTFGCFTNLLCVSTVWCGKWLSLGPDVPAAKYDACVWAASGQC